MEDLRQQITSPQIIEEKIEQNLKDGIRELQSIERCVQYEDNIFCFGISGEGEYFNGEGYYFSLNHEEWMRCNWKPFKQMTSLDILYQPQELFLAQAQVAYKEELPITEDQELQDSFNPEEAEICLEFVCGSELELKRLTKIAATTLLKLRNMFEQSSELRVIYKAETKYHSGGVARIETDVWDDEIVLDRQVQQIFDLIFEYNFFTGLHWEYNDDGYGYTSYDPCPYTVEVEVQAPSYYERLEAEMELRSWLEGKLPEDETESYFEK